MVKQSYDNIPDSVEIPDLEEVPHIVEGRDLETLIVASIETLKRNNEKYGKEEVLHLVQESVDSEVTKEHFEELLDKLIKCQSVHSHKKRIVWKHGPNRPFYALMLRTKLY